MGSRVTSIRLSEEELKKFKEIAERRGIDFNTLVREALRMYVKEIGGPPLSEGSQLPSLIEDVLVEFKGNVDKLVSEVKQFCEEHGRIISESSEKEHYAYWRDVCLHRHRRTVFNTLKVYVKEKLYKHIDISKLTREEQLELEKRINDIIREAVNSIYPSQYPPMYQ